MTHDTATQLRMERRLDAPVETVFEALTTAEAIARWYGPDDAFDVTVHEWDCREGGRYRVEMQDPKGDSHVVGGEFKDIVPGEKVSYTWSWEGQDMDTLVIFRIEPDGDGTHLVLTHSGFPSDDSRARHVEGWTGSLDRLEREAGR